MNSTTIFPQALRRLGTLALAVVALAALLVAGGCAVGNLPFAQTSQPAASPARTSLLAQSARPPIEFVLPTEPTGAGGPSQPVFGPQNYTRATGAPSTVTSTFSIPAGVTAPYLLRIENGSPAVAGAKPVTSATVTLNGVQVAGPSDFGAQVTLIEKTVTLSGGNNTLAVSLAGSPGAAFRLRILGSPLQTAPTSLAPNPIVITAGATSNLTATLSPAPQSAGNLSVASANNAVASVPASVAFSAGQTSVVIPVTGVTAGNATINASLNGVTASATVNVTPAPPTIASLLPSSLLVTQGASGTLTLTLTSAPATNTTVALSSSAPGIANVPASITLPAGQLTTSIAINGVSPGTSQISASLNGSTVTSQITVNPAPPTVVSLLPVNTSITLGASTNLTLTISAAQATPTVVPLGAGPAGIVAVPAQITIPAGQTSASFAVSATALGQAGVTASLNGSSSSAVVNVISPPVAVVSLLPATFTMNVGAVGAYTVTINATQPVNTEVALSVDNPALLQLPASVTIAQGQVSATFTVTARATGNAVITASANNSSKTAAVHVSPEPAAIVSLLPNPLPLQQGATGNLTVTLNVAQEAATTVTLASSAPAIAPVAATISIPPGQLTALIPVNALAPGDATLTATVTAAGNTTTASATVQVTLPPPLVTSITAATLTLPKGTPGTLRVNVSRAPNTATAVTLITSNLAAVSVPPTVNIAAGALFAELPVSANAIGQATITASLNGGTASSSVTVTPAEVTALTLSPQTPTAYTGQNIPFTATAAMTDGTNQNFTGEVTWASSDSTTASIVNLPNAPNNGVATTIANGPTTISASYTFTAAQSGQSTTVTANTVLTVKAPVGLALSAANNALQPGQSTPVTITSPDPAPAGGLTMSLTQSGTGTGSFPATVVMAAGQNSATFTYVATTAGAVTLTANAPNRLPGMLAMTIAPLFSITGINPASGPPGSTVTLSGIGFNPTAANNTVTFSGNAGTPVLTATATQLTVTVPANAQSGPVTVSNSNGTANSPPFTVTPREQDYQLVVSPANVTVYQGAAGIAQVQISSAGAKPYTGLVTVTVSGLPSGVTASVSPAATLSAFQVGAITFTATAAAVPGNTTVIVQAVGADGGTVINRTATVNLTVASAAGITGVKGRFVTPEGQGIAGIIVRADVATNPQPQTSTDAAGNFSLAGLPPGQVTFRFDATPANPLYPIWPYSVTLAANQIAVMADWTINPPPPNERFTTINNAAQDQFITDTRYPGLSIKLPAGVSITGWDGVVKTRIAVEQIDINKLPVPPPPAPVGTAYQLYFGTPMGGVPSAPIPVTLPNDVEAEPGESVPVYYFDGSPLGGTGEWKVAGQGIVSADGKTVSMAAGIPRFCGVCGAVCLGKVRAGADKGKGCPIPTTGNPVNLFSGQELPKTGGLTCGGITPIDTGMSYNPIDAFNNIAGTSGSIGLGWMLDYDIAFLPFSGPQKRIILPPNEHVNFVDDGAGNYKPFNDPRFDGAVIRATNLVANEWELSFKDGRKWRFKPFAGIPGRIRGGPPTFVTEMVDVSGNVLSITRQTNGRITAVGNQGRSVAMTYGANGFVSEITDNANRVMRYAYTPTNRITSVTDADNKITRYTYVDDTEIPPAAACSGVQSTTGERIKTILYPGRPNPTTNFYGSARRVLRQLGYDGLETKIAYKVTGACVAHTSTPAVACTVNCPDVDSWENFNAGWRIHGGRVIATTVTEPNGATKNYTYNAAGALLSTTDGLGQQGTRKLDAAHRVIQQTDAIGRTWKYQYDANGNRIQEIDPLNRVMDYTYDAKWNQSTSTTRYLADNTAIRHQTAYDPITGKVIRTTDPLNNITTFGYTPRAELNAITVPGNRTTTLEYNTAGDVVKIVNAGGSETLFQTDGAGRTITTTDPLGFDTRTEYNGVSQVTKTIDPLLQETRLTYDPAQRPESVIDPRNNTIERYQYDNNDRITAVTDALNKSTNLQYDTAGRLSQSTDRKGQVTTYTYDNLNRPITINFAGVTRTVSYDAIGRINRINEPGTSISYAYDTVDRITSVTSDSAAGRHVVGYEYDNIDRLTRRTVNGADPTTYSYDNASRLTSIGYRNQTTTYTWDTSSRLTAKTLPNGIKQELAYDNADRLLSLAYRKTDNSVIETITYTYDAKGQRLSKSLSGTSTRETPFTATYDAANRMSSITLTGTNQSYTLNYDDNGNLTSKTDTANATNITNYSWDSRNRLIGITAPGTTASFKYDVLGRRIEKTVNSNTVNYIYDGDQAIAEVTAGAVSAAILTGPNIDEVLARYAGSGNRTYLTDALGSVIAQANDTQAVENYYSYTPYGETQSSGPDGGNASQYTARENDGTGLYYYRARYYDPILKRFISSDPIGLDGGINAYAYVGGNPVSFADPSGLTPGTAIGAGIGTAIFPGVGTAVGAVVGTAIQAAIVIGGALIVNATGSDSQNSGTGNVCKPGIPDVQPGNLCEKLALAEAKAGAGVPIMSGLADSPRLVAIYGPGPWIKKQHTHRCPDGRLLVIHYFSNGMVNVELKFV
jgi:RHS repeat-associated protein